MIKPARTVMANTAPYRLATGTRSLLATGTTGRMASPVTQTPSIAVPLAVIKTNMKTLLYTLTILLIMSCGQRNNNSLTESKTSDKDSTTETLALTEDKIEFSKYVADGMFLKGSVQIFDNELKSIGKLEINSITIVQILEKSTKMYNIEGKPDKCDKANFLKVKYRGNDYTVFGQEVYEINNQQKFSTQNDKNEKLTLFPITNFEMGAADEIGLSECDEYSLLMLHNESKNHYTLMKYPSNEDIHGRDRNKYASLFNDDMSEEKIYKLTTAQDTLIIGIKAKYQMGGSVFNLNVILSKEFPETRISDRVRFETDEELKKMDEYK
jgi:hypothetical protein